MRIIDKSLAPKYDETKTYKVDDVVVVGNKMYKCIEQISEPESFNSTKWERTYLVSEINSNLGSEVYYLGTYQSSNNNNIDISTIIPNFDKLTVDNFMVGVTQQTLQYSADSARVDTITYTYDATTGILNIPRKYQTDGGTNGVWTKFKVWVCTGEIITV